MKQQTIGKAVLGFLGLAVLVSLGSSNRQEHDSEQDAHGDSEAEAEHAEGREEGPHERAPRNVKLDADRSEWLRAPGEEWFLAQPDRFEGGFKSEGRPAYQDIHTKDIYVNIHDAEQDADAWYLSVSRSRLTDGRRDYVQYCASCHGFDGLGYGRSAQGLRPPPRNFLSGNFKFTKTLAPYPTDEAMIELIKKGLDGTPMLKWDLSDRQLSDIVQYIKSLSAEDEAWRDIYAEIGDKVDMGDDPWVEDLQRGIDRGERVYHVKGACYSCHPTYVSETRVREFEGEGSEFTNRPDPSYPVLKESDYKVLGQPINFFPPDFTWHQLRSGATTRDLAETIAAGIKGTAMPQWKNSIPDRDIWALAHYVEKLIHEYKDQPSKRSAFFAPLRAE